MISQDVLKKELRYEPETGLFYRLNGEVAGSVRGGTHRYSRISVLSEKYQAHELAFVYMLGNKPEGFVDHINGDPFDNRWENLRIVTSSDNSKNKQKPSNNKSGLIGVHWDSRGNKWKAQINSKGCRVHLGYFTDFFEACCARKSAQNAHGFHKNHSRNPLQTV